MEEQAEEEVEEQAEVEVEVQAEVEVEAGHWQEESKVEGSGKEEPLNIFVRSLSQFLI